MDWLTHLADAPVANVMFLAGLAFLAVGVFGKIAGKVEPDKIGRAGSALARVLLIALGLYFHVTGDADKARADQQKNAASAPATAGSGAQDGATKPVNGPDDSPRIARQKAQGSAAREVSGKPEPSREYQPRGAGKTVVESVKSQSSPQPSMAAMRPPVAVPQPAVSAPQPPPPQAMHLRYFRLQLKHGGQFLDADNCTTAVRTFGYSGYDNGACQLWLFIPAGDGYYRLQSKHSGQYLDADHCTTTLALFGYSGYDAGACQLWRRVPEPGGYFRLQSKHSGQYLDADHCTSKVALFGRSDWENGACQLWRLVPENVRID